MKAMKKIVLGTLAMLAGLAAFPPALAAQSFVYVHDDALYDGVPPKSNTVSAFSVGPGGALTPVPGSPFSTGAGHFGCFGGNYATPRLAIAGTFLYASNCHSHSISTFSIDAGTGVLTLLGTPLSLLPKPANFNPDISLATTPNGEYLVAATRPELPGTILHVFSIGAAGELTPVPSSPTSLACPGISGIKISPSGAFLVVPCGLNSEIHVLGIGASGALTPVTGSPFASASGSTVEINSTSTRLFLGRSTEVVVFNLGADGSLTPISTSSTVPAQGMGTLVLSPDDQRLYASHPPVRSVSAWNVAPDGTLTQVTGSPFVAEPSHELSFDGPVGLALDPCGPNLFAAAGALTWPSGVYAFDIEGNGALTNSTFHVSNPEDGIPQSLAVFSTCGSTDTVGPITSNVLAGPVAINTPTTLTALVDDTTTGGSKIASASYTVDGGALVAMNPADGGFNHVIESVTATLAPFSVAGVRSICVRGTDQPGNTGAASCIYLPVYDPTGSFVTGGGAVHSPEGADSENTSAEGPATFGFVSRYKPGKSTPDGNLEFHFKAGTLTFKSTSLDWLVVTGEPRARFQGTGTINGTTACKFVVDAWDLSNGREKADLFGLTVFDCSNGRDRYYLSPVPLSQGNIIIHK